MTAFDARHGRRPDEHDSGWADPAGGPPLSAHPPYVPGAYAAEQYPTTPQPAYVPGAYAAQPPVAVPYPTGPYPPSPGRGPYGHVDLTPHPPVGAARRRSRGPVAVVATVVAVVVLLGGGTAVVAAVRYWFGTGEQAESATPASVGAFIRLDLDPSLDQGVKLLKLIRQFPDTENFGDQDPDLARGIFDGLELDGMNFDSDVKPWFGHNVAVAAWSDADQQPYVLGILASTDDTLARAALEKAKAQSEPGELGYVVRDGWVLLAGGEKRSQEAADAAAAEAATSSLAADARFATALDAMPGGQLLVGWSDVARVRGQLGKATKEVESLLSGAGQLSIDGLTGYAMSAVQAGDRGIEFRVRAGGFPKPLFSGSNIRPVLDELPGNAIVAMAVGTDPASRPTSQLLTGLDPGCPTATSCMPGELGAAVTALADAKRLSLAITEFSDDDLPGLRLSAETASDEAASNVASVAELLDEFHLTIDRQGARVDLSTPGYTATDTLSGLHLYREAMADTPERLELGFYVDVKRMLAGLEADGETARDLAPLKAVAGGYGVEHGEIVGMVRVVIG